MGAGPVDRSKVGGVANRRVGVLGKWRLPGTHHQGGAGLLPGHGHSEWLDNGSPHYQDNEEPYAAQGHVHCS